MFWFLVVMTGLLLFFCIGVRWAIGSSRLVG